LFSLSIIDLVSSSVIPEVVSPFGKYEDTQCLTGQLGVMLDTVNFQKLKS